MIALETALKRRANDQDPFDVDWKKAEAVYHRDLTQRIWCTVWKGIGVGLVRDKAMAIAIRAWSRMGFLSPGEPSRRYVEANRSRSP